MFPWLAASLTPTPSPYGAATTSDEIERSPEAARQSSAVLRRIGRTLRALNTSHWDDWLGAAFGLFVIVPVILFVIPLMLIQAAPLAIEWWKRRTKHVSTGEAKSVSVVWRDGRAVGCEFVPAPSKPATIIRYHSAAPQ